MRGLDRNTCPRTLVATILTHIPGWLFCVPHYSCSAALATYFLRQSLVSTYDIELGPEKGFGTDRMGVGTPSAWYCCLLTQQVAFLEEVTDKDARMRAEDDARLASSRKSDSDSAAAAGGKQAGEAVVGSSADKAATDTAPQQEQPMQSTSKAD